MLPNNSFAHPLLGLALPLGNLDIRHNIGLEIVHKLAIVVANHAVPLFRFLTDKLIMLMLMIKVCETYYVCELKKGEITIVSLYFVIFAE